MSIKGPRSFRGNTNTKPTPWCSCAMPGALPTYSHYSHRRCATPFPEHNIHRLPGQLARNEVVILCIQIITAIVSVVLGKVWLVFPPRSVVISVVFPSSLIVAKHICDSNPSYCVPDRICACGLIFVQTWYMMSGKFRGRNLKVIASFMAIACLYANTHCVCSLSHPDVCPRPECGRRPSESAAPPFRPVCHPN